MNTGKNVNVKNLKKGVLYFIKQKDEEPIGAYFDKNESVKYVRFKTYNKEPLLVSKTSKFYYPHKSGPTKKVNSPRTPKNSPTRKYNRKRYEFEPTSVKRNNN